MAVLTFSQVASYMIGAGFTSSNGGVELLAIAMRESRLDSSAHNPGSNYDHCSDDCGYGPGCCDYACESSWGLWQINRCAFPQFSASYLQTGPGSAAACWEVSEHGTNLDPWNGLVNVEQEWLDSAEEAFTGLPGGGNPITPAAANYLAEMMDMFPSADNLGVYVCKQIVDSDTYSQHSWGNAVDLGATGQDLANMAAYVLDNAVRLNIRTLCWGNSSWTPDGGTSSQPCNGDHSTHLHADFLPGCLGIPPCAGGPPDNTCGAISGTASPGTAGCAACGPTLNPATILECLACQLGGVLGDVFEKVFAYSKIAAGGIVLMFGGAIAVYGASGVTAPAVARKAALAIPQVRAASAVRGATKVRAASARRKVAEDEAATRVRTVSEKGRTRVQVASRRKARAESRDDEERASAARTGRQKARLADLRSRRPRRSPPRVEARRRIQPEEA